MAFLLLALSYNEIRTITSYLRLPTMNFENKSFKIEQSTSQNTHLYACSHEEVNASAIEAT